MVDINRDNTLPRDIVDEMRESLAGSGDMVDRIIDDAEGRRR